MRSEFQHPEILDWFDRRTFGPSNPGPFKPDPGLLAELKRESDLRVSVCLPALNEQTTIGDMCTSIRTEFMERVDLVDELVGRRLRLHGRHPRSGSIYRGRGS